MKKVLAANIFSVLVGLVFNGFVSARDQFERGTEAHLVVSLPHGVSFTHTTSEAEKRVSVVFSGLSVVELDEYCNQSLARNDDVVCYHVESTSHGAALVIDLSKNEASQVVLSPFPDRSQLVIGVYDRGGRSLALNYDRLVDCSTTLLSI